jgi:hypothetical protein
MALTSHQQEKRVQQKVDVLIEEAKQVDRADPGERIVALMAARLAEAEVAIEDLHDRVLDLEGRSGEKPNRTPLTLN